MSKLKNKSRPSLPINWRSLDILHVTNNALLSAATHIDDFGIDPYAFAVVSEKLKQKHGISLRQFRDCCDFLAKIEQEENDKALEWDKKYLQKE